MDDYLKTVDGGARNVTDAGTVVLKNVGEILAIMMILFLVFLTSISILELFRKYRARFFTDNYSRQVNDTEMPTFDEAIAEQPRRRPSPRDNHGNIVMRDDTGTQIASKENSSQRNVDSTTAADRGEAGNSKDDTNRDDTRRNDGNTTTNDSSVNLDDNESKEIQFSRLKTATRLDDESSSNLASFSI